jgi:hypothetical protein
MWANFSTAIAAGRPALSSAAFDTADYTQQKNEADEADDEGLQSRAIPFHLTNNNDQQQLQQQRIIVPAINPRPQQRQLIVPSPIDASFESAILVPYDQSSTTSSDDESPTSNSFSLSSVVSSLILSLRPSEVSSSAIDISPLSSEPSSSLFSSSSSPLIAPKHTAETYLNVGNSLRLDDQNRDDDITCPVCLDFFVNPQILLCRSESKQWTGHSVCSNCIDGLKKAQKDKSKDKALRLFGIDVKDALKDAIGLKSVLLDCPICRSPVSDVVGSKVLQSCVNERLDNSIAITDDERHDFYTRLAENGGTEKVEGISYSLNQKIAAGVITVGAVGYGLFAVGAISTQAKGSECGSNNSVGATGGDNTFVR